MRNGRQRQGNGLTRAAGAALVLASVTALAWCASALGRDASVSSDRSAANLTAFGSSLAWSREESNGRHRLVSYTRLQTLGSQPPPADLAVRASSSPFDPDLGVDRKGNPAVVYTRCAGVSGRNCDVYGFDGKVESKVRGASSSRCSEFAPSIWKGIIAFARSGSRRCNGLYLKGRGPLLRLDRRIPADTDIRGNRVAYLHAPSSRRTFIRIFSFSREGGRSHVVVAGVRAQGERTRVTYPEFSGRYIYFLFEDLRRDDFLVGRSRVESGSVLEFSQRKLPGFVDSIGVDGNTVYFTNGRGVFQASDPAPRFSARD
jgi:hypothetical protein